MPPARILPIHQGMRIRKKNAAEETSVPEVAAAVPEFAPVEQVGVLPALPPVAEGVELPAATEYDVVRESARAHALRLLASRDALTDPSRDYRYTNARPVSGDVLAVALGFPHLVSGDYATGPLRDGRPVREWVGDGSWNGYASVASGEYVDLMLPGVYAGLIYDSLVQEFDFNPEAIIEQARLANMLSAVEASPHANTVAFEPVGVDAATGPPGAPVADQPVPAPEDVPFVPADFPVVSMAADPASVTPQAEQSVEHWLPVPDGQHFGEQQVQEIVPAYEQVYVAPAEGHVEPGTVEIHAPAVEAAPEPFYAPLDAPVAFDPTPDAIYPSSTESDFGVAPFAAPVDVPDAPGGVDAEDGATTAVDRVEFDEPAPQWANTELDSGSPAEIDAYTTLSEDAHVFSDAPSLTHENDAEGEGRYGQ